MIAILFASRIPAWSGMMHFVQHSNLPVKSYLVFLQIIEIWNATCIVWALPIINYDQPLILEGPADYLSCAKKKILELHSWRLPYWDEYFLGGIVISMAKTGLQKSVKFIYAANVIGCTCTPCGRCPHIRECVWCTWCDSKSPISSTKILKIWIYLSNIERQEIWLSR